MCVEFYVCGIKITADLSSGRRIHLPFLLLLLLLLHLPRPLSPLFLLFLLLLLYLHGRSPFLTSPKHAATAPAYLADPAPRFADVFPYAFEVHGSTNERDANFFALFDVPEDDGRLSSCFHFREGAM